MTVFAKQTISRLLYHRYFILKFDTPRWAARLGGSILCQISMENLYLAIMGHISRTMRTFAFSRITSPSMALA